MYLLDEAGVNSSDVFLLLLFIRTVLEYASPIGTRV